MKVLVTGSSGLIGSQIIVDLKKQNHDVFSCYNYVRPNHGQPIHLDITDYDVVTKVISEIKPDIVLHLAALTDVDKCETNPDLAISINGNATQNISKISHDHNAFFLYVSTDYVFDGKIGNKKENDKANPLGNYGKSKLIGEKAVQNLPSNWCICRTSTPFGLHFEKTSFPFWVAKKLHNDEEINVVTDQITSPTYVPNLSKMLIEIINKKIQGILHVSGASVISRYDLAKMTAEKLGLDTKNIHSTSVNTIDWVAPRPKNSSLDVSKATRLLENKPMIIEKTLNLFINEFKNKL